MKKFPDFSFESPLWERGLSVLGMDEVGRGAFAGPLAVGGVVFNQDLASKILQLGINDSKKISQKRREKLSPIIKNHSLFWFIEYVSVDEINEIGIGKANLNAMKKVYLKAINNFSDNLFTLVDAFKIPDVENQKAIIRGDSLSITIAAASIIAKVARDELMRKLSHKFNNYDLENNKGYGTLSHRNALKTFGPTVHHRDKFIRRFI